MVETVINQNDGFVSITAVGGELDLDGDFPIYEKSHVTIKRTRSGTTTTLVLNTDYTIADNQLEVTAGFSAVLAGSATPAVAGDVYTLLLDVPESRTTDFTQAGDFFAATLNEELDLQTQMMQQLRRDVDKSAHLPDTSTISTVILPEPENLKLIGWDGTDGTMANYDVDDLGGIAVSSFGEDWVGTTTTSSARSKLGLGTAALENIEAIVTSPVASSDNSLDVGSAAKRWKDMYIGGGVYLGGTGAANKLDDYEVGTWTPAFSSTGATFSPAMQIGDYVKTGQAVICPFRLSITAPPGGTTSNSLFLTGLPFAVKTTTNMLFGLHAGHYNNFNITAGTTVALQGASGGAFFELKAVGDALAETPVLASAATSNAEIRGVLIYITA